MTIRRRQNIAPIFVLLLSAACGSAPPPKPKAPPYSPRYSYHGAASDGKLEVTVGLVNEQYGQRAKPAQAAVFGAAVANPWDEPLGRSFATALRTSFHELLSSKGFNVTGPFDSVENMTFPEKKTADLILVPVIDVEYASSAKQLGVKQDGNMVTGYSTVVTCSATVSANGSVSVEAREPLSGEKMWIKRVEITAEPRSIEYDAEVGKTCSEPPQEFMDANAQLLEKVYATIMGGLDKYVNGEEFVALKTQSAELRAKKAY